MRTLLLLGLLTIAANAHAAVTDLFDCQLSIVEKDGSTTLSQTNRLAVIRKPEGQQNGRIYTRGDARMAIQTKRNGVLLRGDLQVVIRHAYQARHNEPDNGTQPAGFQSSAFALVTFTCDRPTCIDQPPHDPGDRNPADLRCTAIGNA